MGMMVYVLLISNSQMTLLVYVKEEGKKISANRGFRTN